MRAFLAGIFCFGGLLLCVGLVFHYFPDGFGPPWLMGISFAALLFAFIVVTMFVFNSPGRRPSFKSAAEQVSDLERKGLLTADTYQAVRAFKVDEFEDEGIHYFIELEDKRVLCLSGQYLYDYDEIADDPEFKQARQFPCTVFTVLWHKKDGYVVDIRLSGELIQLDCVAPPYDKSDFKNDLIYEDGQIVSDRTYEDLKRERLKGRAG